MRIKMTHGPERRFAGVAMLFALMVALAACTGATSSPGATSAVAGETSVAETTEPSEAAAGTPAPTDLQEMPIGLLPQASPVPSSADVTCEEPASGGTDTLTCDEALLLAARIGKAMTSGEVQQVVVARGAESGADDPAFVKITVWAEDAETLVPTAYSALVDKARDIVQFPYEDTEAPTLAPA
jgi:hypothetical protein